MSFGDLIRALAGIGICTFICESVITNKTLSKALSLITSLCVFTVVISPIISFTVKGDIRDILDTSKYEKTFSETATDFTLLVENDIENRISQSIEAQFGLQAADISADITITEDEALVEAVSVLLDNDDAYAKEQISEYLLGIFGNETRISVTEKTQ